MFFVFTMHLHHRLGKGSNTSVNLQTVYYSTVDNVHERKNMYMYNNV